MAVRQIEEIRVCPFCHKPGAGAVPWSQALCVLIVPPRDVRSPAALMVEAGAHPKYLQAQMGHSTIKTTLDTYGHLFPDANRSVLDALDGITTEPADQMNDPILTPSRPKSEAEPGEKVACFQHFLNGACRDRTGDLRLAKRARAVAVTRRRSPRSQEPAENEGANRA